MAHEELLDRGRTALEAWSWTEAKTAFESMLAERQSAEAWEGLGIAVFWLDEPATAIAARERAYALYRECGDTEAAARLAAGIADAVLMFRGEPAVAAGWLQRGRRALARHPESPVMSLIDTLDAFLKMAYERDVARAVELGEAAVARARSCGAVEIEMVALSVLGVVLVSTGRFAEGMRMLDESTTAIISGDVRTPDIAANICCAFVTATARARDFDRLAQWSQHVMDLASQWSNRSMFSYPRTEHAAALAWWGRWHEAECELRATIEDMRGQPLLASLAMLRLADLLRKQGRFDEATDLVDELERRPNGLAMGNLTGAVHAALALDRGDLVRAGELAERYLRLVPPDDIIERVAGLEVLVQARVAKGDIDHAAEAANELAAAAEVVPTRALRAAARLAAGRVAAGRGDQQEALSSLEQAVQLYEASKAPFEEARARVELGRVLLAAGSIDVAREEMRRALHAFETLGTPHQVESTAAALGPLAKANRHASNDLPLTPREVEVLRLLAAGRPNDEIAERLVLSVRTVERHVSNIYAKIGTYGSTARTVATAYAHTHGLM